MSFNKNLVVAGFTLALLVASSYGGDFPPGANNPSYGGIMAGNYCQCHESTGTACASDGPCRTNCRRMGDPYIVGGYCFKPKAGSPSTCMCIRRCVVAKSRHGAAAPASA